MTNSRTGPHSEPGTYAGSYTAVYQHDSKFSSNTFGSQLANVQKNKYTGMPSIIHKKKIKRKKTGKEREKEEDKEKGKKEIKRKDKERKK